MPPGHFLVAGRRSFRQQPVPGWYMLTWFSLSSGCAMQQTKEGSMTLDRYSHWIPSMGRHAAEGMDEALGR